MLVVPVVAVVGPTASGKTDLSLDLAERLGGEIVNTDAMQVYRGMDIGTAKLPPAQRRSIPHHLLDTLSVRDPATVAEFQGWAREVIDDLRGQWKLAGPGRRLRALHPRDPGPLRVPGHRRRHPARARGGAGAGRVGRAAPAASGSGPGGCGTDHSGQRPPDRPRARGHRAHRPTVQREPSEAGVPLRQRPPDRRTHRPADARRADRAASRPDVRRRLRRRGRRGC